MNERTSRLEQAPAPMAANSSNGDASAPPILLLDRGPIAAIGSNVGGGGGINSRNNRNSQTVDLIRPVIHH